MGFTQYWYREKTIDQAIYNNIVADFKKIRAELFHRGVLLAGLNGDGVPIITDSQINFNGSAKLQGSGSRKPLGMDDGVIYQLMDASRLQSNG